MPIAKAFDLKSGRERWNTFVKRNTQINYGFSANQIQQHRNVQNNRIFRHSGLGDELRIEQLYSRIQKKSTICDGTIHHFYRLMNTKMIIYLLENDSFYDVKFRYFDHAWEIPNRNIPIKLRDWPPVYANYVHHRKNPLLFKHLTLVLYK